MIKTNSLFINKMPTNCCSFAQMSAISSTPIKDIEYFITKAKEESKRGDGGLLDTDHFGHTHCAGQRAYFCITMPSESALEERLKQAGFEYLTSFKRRYCYSDHETAELKMWIIKW